jgi:hypothetical protein
MHNFKIIFSDWIRSFLAYICSFHRGYMLNLSCDGSDLGFPIDLLIIHIEFVFNQISSVWEKILLIFPYDPMKCPVMVTILDFLSTLNTQFVN